MAWNPNFGPGYGANSMSGKAMAVLLPFRPGATTGRLALTALFTPRIALLLCVLITVASIAPALAQGDGTRPGVLSLMWKWTPTLFEGFLFNILISFLSMAIGTVLGVTLGILQVSLTRPVRWSAWVVTQFFRNAPWLVLLFYCIQWNQAPSPEYRAHNVKIEQAAKSKARPSIIWPVKSIRVLPMHSGTTWSDPQIDPALPGGPESGPKRRE